MIRKTTPGVRKGVRAKADTVKIPKEVADQLKIAQRLVERYYKALRDVTQ